MIGGSLSVELSNDEGPLIAKFPYDFDYVNKGRRQWNGTGFETEAIRNQESQQI